MATDLNYYSNGDVLANAGIALNFKDISTGALLPSVGSVAPPPAEGGGGGGGGTGGSITFDNIQSFITSTASAIGGSIRFIDPPPPPSRPANQPETFEQLYNDRDQFLNERSSSGGLVGDEPWNNMWTDAQKLGYVPVFTDPQTGEELTYAYVGNLLGINLPTRVTNITVEQYLTHQLEEPWHAITNALFGRDLRLLNTVRIPLTTVQGILNNIGDEVASLTAGIIAEGLEVFATGEPTGVQSQLALNELVAPAS